MSGVGISFGADRIFDVMNHLTSSPKDSTATNSCTFELGKRRGFLSSRTENLTERRNQFRDIPGSRQDEETNDLRR